MTARANSLTPLLWKEVRALAPTFAAALAAVLIGGPSNDNALVAIGPARLCVRRHLARRAIDRDTSSTTAQSVFSWRNRYPARDIYLLKFVRARAHDRGADHNHAAALQREAAPGRLARYAAGDAPDGGNLWPLPGAVPDDPLPQHARRRCLHRRHSGAACHRAPTWWACGFTGRTNAAAVDHFKEDVFWRGMFAICGLAAIAGWWTFARLEVIEGHRDIALPGWLTLRAADRDMRRQRGQAISCGRSWRRSYACSKSLTSSRLLYAATC